LQNRGSFCGLQRLFQIAECNGRSQAGDRIIGPQPFDQLGASTRFASVGQQPESKGSARRFWRSRQLLARLAIFGFKRLAQLGKRFGRMDSVGSIGISQRLANAIDGIVAL
jgi:hypothetical protein